MDDAITQIGLLDEPDILLDEAALALAMLDHPGLPIDPYEKILEDIATRLADAGADATTGRERAGILARIFSGEYGFAGDADTYDDPANADLIRVIDRRRGLPISLAILYVAAARRIGWTADILDVPGHVLVLVGDTFAPVIIDPFRGGAAVAPQQLASLLASSADRAARPIGRVAPMPNRAVLTRLILNQATRAEAAGDGQRARTLYERITTFAPAYVHGWRERARLELRDGDVTAARGSLSAILETTRDPAIRDGVAGTLRSLAGDSIG